MIILKDYQQKAVNDLMNIYRAQPKDCIPLFIAPTGAGKTIMTGSLINQISAENKKACFIWISIGKSGLHEQSKYKIEKFYPKLKALDMQTIRSTAKQNLDPGDILFLNWESITSKSKKTGQWLNIFMKPNENITLNSLVQCTKNLGNEIVLLVDEAHAKSASLRGNEILKIISPTVTFNITATPRKKQYEEAKNQIVKVASKDVINEGVIKKSIIVNKGIRFKNNIITDLLDTANRRREQLCKLYKDEGSSVNPLCIVQLPNGREGLAIAEEIKNHLQSLGKTEQNGKVAIWLSDDKINLECIDRLDATQEFLLFKQAIDTGWDCPRASILVKYRDIKSDVFKEQIIGRILRMPELKHYRNPILNDAYIFTDEETFTVDKPEELPEDIVTFTESIPIKEDMYDKVIYSVIPSFSYIKFSSMLNIRGLMLDFARYLKEHMDYFEGQYNLLKGQIHSMVPVDLVYNTVDGTVNSTNSKDVALPTAVLRGTIEIGLKKVLTDEKVRSGVFDYIMNARPKTTPLRDYLEMLVINMNYILYKLTELLDAHNTHPTLRIDELPIIYNSIPPKIPVATEPFNNPTFDKLVYMWYPYSTVAKEDKKIIEELEADDEVEWWFYNRTYAYAVGLPALVENNLITYKPRFVLKRGNNIVALDYTKDYNNFKEIQRMLEIWKYKAGLPNIDIDLRYLGDEK